MHLQPAEGKLPLQHNPYEGKTALVLGAARSGTAAAELLLSLGARVILNDIKQAEVLGEMPESLIRPECDLRLGQEPGELFGACDFVIISPGIPLESPVLAPARENGLPILGELAFAASCAKSDIIAVSGTNGKTTTVSMLGEIFKRARMVAHVTGNIGYPLSAAVLRAKESDLLIAEVSSFQLETGYGFHPAAAVMLNVTPDHLDRHGSMDTYEKMKLRLFQNMDGSELAILNMDDPRSAAMAEQIKPKIDWFSARKEVPAGAMLKDGWIMLRTSEGDKALCLAGELKIPGLHNVENALAAAALASGFGVPAPVIAYAIKNFQGVEHRIEYVNTINGVRYFNDSKGTNPDSTIKAVESMQAPTVLIAGGYDKGVSFDLLASIIAVSSHVRYAVLFGATSERIRDALLKAGFMDIVVVPDLAEAVHVSSGLAVPGGNVLFSPACASFDMFSDYEQRGRFFKQFVLELTQEGE